MWPLTHTAISSASAIESGIVPERVPEIVGQRLPEDRVVGELAVVVGADEHGGRAPLGVD